MIMYPIPSFPLLWRKWSIYGEKMTAWESTEGVWLWELIILRSPQKQMYFAAIGGNGNNQSYGKVKNCFSLAINHLQSFIINYEIFLSGSKVLQMLWLLSFSWKMYIIRWGAWLLLYMGVQNFFSLGRIQLESWWE